MIYTLQNFIDLSKVQKILGSLKDAFGLPVALIDNEGNTITGNASQLLCDRFCCVHPDAESLYRQRVDFTPMPTALDGHSSIYPSTNVLTD